MEENKVPQYGLKRILGDTLTLTKNDKPIMVIPDEAKDDFIYMLSRVSSYDKFMNTPVDDIPTNLFTHSSETEEKIIDELNNKQ